MSRAHKVGYPAYTFHLYEQVYDTNGLPIEGCYVDQNGDGTIDDNDRVFRHSKDPKVTLSWNNTFSYRSWDLGFQLRASIGNYVYNDVASTHSTLSATYNTSGANLIKTDFYFQGGQTTNTYLSDYRSTTPVSCAATTSPWATHGRICSTTISACVSSERCRTRLSSPSTKVLTPKCSAASTIMSIPAPLPSLSAS